MSWASRRRALIITIAGAVALAALAILAFSVFYKVPTCIDHTQNQDELGVDCGGSCTTLCAAQVREKPTAKFVRALSPLPGRTDVVAYIDNPNGNAEAKSAPFTLELYTADGGLAAKKSVTIDLPPSATVPFYMPDVAPRGVTIARAFLTNVAESTVWTKPGDKLVLPTVENISPSDTEPRITATLVNPLAKPLYNTTLVATVYDEAGNVIAASETLVPTLPSQGTAPLIFTWNEPFSSPVARVEILPVPHLPRI